MRTVLLVIIAVSCWPVVAQEADTRDEFWPEFDVYLKLNDKSRLFFIYSATKQDNRQTFADGMTGGHIDFYTFPWFRLRSHDHDASRSKLLMIRVGYLFTRTPSEMGSSDEHTPTMEVNARFPLPGGVLLTDRSRGDLRFVSGVFTPRYRNRLKLERSFQAGRFDLTPYAHAEAFYDWRYNKFHRLRYSAGAEMSLTKFLVIEGYYLRQNDTKASPRYVNAVGFALQLYLR